VSGLKVKQSGKRKLKVSWKRSCGAVLYAVTAMRGTKVASTEVTGTRAKIAAPPGKGRVVVTVSAVGYSGVVGPARRFTIKG
jgi:hypothetical protein